MRFSAVAAVLVMVFTQSAFAQDVPDSEPETETETESTDADIEVVSSNDATAEEESPEARAERLEEARLLFLAAQRAFDDGRYPDALASFERSYLLAEDPQILYNIGVTLDRLRRDDEALEAFQMYLRLRPNTPDRRSIEARIQILEDQIARREAAAAPPEPEETGPRVEFTATGAEPEPSDDDAYTVLDRWWFWTAVVAIVAGGAIAIGIVASQDPSPAPGTDGVVLEALSW